MGAICRQCKNYKFNKRFYCTEDINKTDTELMNENYPCFKQRHLYIDVTPRHVDSIFDVYCHELSDREIGDFFKYQFKQNRNQESTGSFNENT